MRVLGLLCVVLRGICWANAASHFLKYIYTVVTGDTDSPEFIITGLVNDEQFVHYDSNIRRMIPQTEWREISVDKQYWDKQTQKALYAHQIFKDNIGNAMQNLTQDGHIIQLIVGCQWNDETGETRGIEHYVYDKKYFLTDDMINRHFIPPAQQLFISAVKWNPAELENDKQYQTQICIELLKKYVSYRSTLERTVAPEVSLLQKNSSFPVVTCHVTGFYPRGITVTWQRNGEDLDEDVELGGTVPNEDGTFQTRSHLRVKPEDWKSQNYTCTVQHKSLKQGIVLPVREENIKRNSDIKTRSFNPDGSSMGVLIGCGVVTYILVLPLTFAVIGFVIWEKRHSVPDYESTKTRSFNPDGSSPLMGVLIGCLVGAFIHVLTLLDFIIWKKRSSDYELTKTFDKDSTNSIEIRPAATKTDLVNSTQPAATDTGPVNPTQPAATDTDSVNSTQPAATDTGPVNSTQPAATDTDSVNSTQPAATDTDSGNSTQPVATDTGPVNSNRPAANDTDLVNSN